MSVCLSISNVCASGGLPASTGTHCANHGKLTQLVKPYDQDHFRETQFVMPIEKLYSDPAEMMIMPAGIGALRITLSPSLHEASTNPITREEIQAMIKAAIDAIPDAE